MPCACPGYAETYILLDSLPSGRWTHSICIKYNNMVTRMEAFKESFSFFGGVGGFSNKFLLSVFDKQYNLLIKKMLRQAHDDEHFVN